MKASHHQQQQSREWILDTHLWYCVCKKLNSSLIRSQFSSMVNLYGWVGCGGPWKLEKVLKNKWLRLNVWKKANNNLTAIFVHLNWINWSCLQIKHKLKTCRSSFNYDILTFHESVNWDVSIDKKKHTIRSTIKKDCNFMCDWTLNENKLFQEKIDSFRRILKLDIFWPRIPITFW